MYQTYTQADSMKNTKIHWKFWLKMRLSPFIYVKQKKKKAACLSMYQTYTQADSMKNTEIDMI